MPLPVYSYLSSGPFGHHNRILFWFQKPSILHYQNNVRVNIENQGAKKIIFTACHSGKLKLALTSPDVVSTSPKKLFDWQN